MNWRQSAKAAEKVIHNLEDQIADMMNYKKLATADIKDYNKCILSMISGGSACDWCEDKAECQLDAKTAGTGCQDWMLAYHDQPEETERTVFTAAFEQEQTPFQVEGSGGAADEST